MSGHSKWATIKHKKGAADKARGKLFAKMARQLEVAAREGGGDPNSNATLRTAVLKAKAGQMTNDAIDRAIKRGTGEDDGRHVRGDHVRGLRARGSGVAHRRADRQPQPHRRRGSQHLLASSAARWPSPAPSAGSSAGVASIMVAGGDEDSVMMAALEAGADDVAADGDGVPRHVRAVRRLRRSRCAARLPGSRSSRRRARWSPATTIEVTDADEARKILRIVDAFEDNDDVQDVYSNFDISDELMETVGV